MNTWTVRLGLSLMIVIGFWSNPLPAQVLVVPTVPYEPAHHVYTPPSFSAPQQPTPSPYPLRRMLNQHGLGCETNSFYPVCSNIHYEMRFIFGSCRSFFGESCPPNAPCHSKRCAP